jgi:pimeloyl-ACP methyl ester carboxylesterase/DNA-binding CsgD family transcriptional regulator/class 3 adenylate cyclase
MSGPVLENGRIADPSGTGFGMPGVITAADVELNGHDLLHAYGPSHRQGKHALVRETRYARNGTANIAYQTFGSGPRDIVLGLGWLSNLDAVWEEPRYARFLSGFAEFANVVAYDSRGSGLSDAIPLSENLSLDDRANDLKAVLDSAKLSAPTLVGFGASGFAFAHFAAMYPDRVGALILINSASNGLARLTSDSTDSVQIDVQTVAPSAAHEPAFTAWWEAFLRRCASPGSALSLARMNAGIDIRPSLPAIEAPTLVLHRAGDRAVPIAHGRELAALIPGATLRELPGDDHLPFIGDTDTLLDEIEQFLTGARTQREPDVDLATILVIDVADSAEVAVALGDRRWADVWSQVEAIIADEILLDGGRPLLSLPSGVVASFRAPVPALQCAIRLNAAIRHLRLTARAGLHAGELPAGRATGSGVVCQLATRVARLARPSEVLATEAVVGLASGADVSFEPAGDYPMPGYPGGWRLHRAGTTSVSGIAPLGDDRPLAMLSPREREIAALIALGLANRQIAGELAISVGTVERHVANMLGKLGYRSRTQIAAWAVDHAILSPPPTK